MADCASIREILKSVIGQKLLDVSQHDEEDVAEGKDSFIELLFENGVSLKFYIAYSEAYVAGVPLVMSDPNAPDEDDVYRPTQEDREGGKWAVVEVIDDDMRWGHVVPTFGQEHRLDVGCWCAPRVEILGIDCRCRRMVTHNAEENGGAPDEH